MLGQEGIFERLASTLRFSEAEATEAILMTHDSALTRFANNVIHQNVAESNATVTIKAVDGQRFGLSTTNDLSDQGLQKAAGRALAHARLQPEDPGFPGLPQPKSVEPAQAYDEETATYSPEARAKVVGRICQLAAGQELDAFGAFRTTTSELAVANSHGLMVYHPATTADLQATVSGQNGSGRAKASGWQVANLNAEAVANAAVDKAVKAQNPQPIDPGEYTVVLDTYAVQDILIMLNMTGMGALSVQEGRSWMNDRIGQQIMNPSVSIWDDGRDPAGVPSPFDFEGMPRQRVQIVEEGTVVGPVYDRYTARKDGRATTGHALPPDMAYSYGPLAVNLFLGAGESSIEEMIQSTERGLSITRFWYTRPVHPRDCVITGMTRDGVWLIEDGRLTMPVKDLRFTQSYVQALANVEAIGRERQTLVSEYGGAVSVPTLKIAGFNFTGRTA